VLHPTAPPRGTLRQSMLLLIDTRPQPPRREPPDVPWRGIAIAATSLGLGIGSSLAHGVVAYGMLLGAVTAAGLGFRGGGEIPWSGMRDHRQ
jgi:hypothetical protein